MEKLISRGMGGVLAKIPVKLRTQQVTSERRQVMSSVEVSSNGVETLSTTRVSMRMTTKSESEAEVRLTSVVLIDGLFGISTRLGISFRPFVQRTELIQG